MSSGAAGSSGSSGKSKSARLILRATLPGAPPQEVYLVRGLSIGRAVDNVFCVEDDTVDRHHAEVQVDQTGRFVVRSLTPGAYLQVGQQQVSELVLDPGSSFRVGPGQFECLAAEPTPSETSRTLWEGVCPRCKGARLPTPSLYPQVCPECGEAILVLQLRAGDGPLVLPARVAQLEALRLAGQGGMALVLEGRQLDNYRPVAIKLMLPHLADREESLQRFRREIALLRQVRHPNVVQIAGWGQWGRLPCLVMAWVDGYTLKQKIEEDRRQARLCSFEEALRWFWHVVQGLDAIHRAGLIHRDIKPSNILIHWSGYALIGDLGVARPVQEQSTALTTTGVPVGTGVYMAPEQIYMPDRVDFRADQYGLGATFYELLTGQAPVGRWPPAPQRNPTVPREFEQVLERLLASDPNDRYANMAELANHLSQLFPHVLRSSPPSPRVAPTPQKMPLWQIYCHGDPEVRSPRTEPTPQEMPPPRAEPTSPDQSPEKGEKRVPVWLLGGLVAMVLVMVAIVLKFVLPPQPPPPPRKVDVQLLGYTTPLYSAVYSPDGQRIITASEDKTARVWDAKTGELCLTLTHNALVNSASFSPDGKKIVTASDDETARVWDAKTGELCLTLTHNDLVYSASFSPDGQRIVTASWNETARVWDAKTGELWLMLTHNKPVYSVSFSPDGQKIVIASDDKTARIWDAKTGELSPTLTHNEPVNSASFSPDGQKIITASYDKTARIWDTKTGELWLTLTHNELVVYSASFSPDGKKIITASYDKTARVWDAKTGELGLTLTHNAPVYSASFSPDGKKIVTASADKTTRVWEAKTGELWLTLTHNKPVNSASFSPDGRRIVTASRDGSTRLWDAASGKEILQWWVSEDGKWVTVTLEGYFTASQEALPLVRHSDGSEGLIPQEESLKYHRPDLVKKALQQ